MDPAPRRFGILDAQVPLLGAHFEHLAPHPQCSDLTCIYGFPLNRVSVTGVAVDAIVRQSRLLFSLDDGTGTVVSCLQWLPSTAAQVQDLSLLGITVPDIGTVVRAHGTIGRFHDQWQLTVACDDVIRDPNEELLDHLLSRTQKNAGVSVARMLQPRMQSGALVFVALMQDPALVAHERAEQSQDPPEITIPRHCKTSCGRAT
ncbi:hypothetical protein AMAG_02825 [Allomyces macrogynus ATCC 38327]|uniref:CST complex subunit STN1 n=1 Tax=Allomyces macrogynus (strain ATCC 38327) TaxID=578462 RepID=A0A0L0S3U1_ALLM3|nr:hypothetical protein AMAG_02825 [Allomyces macrogynus ATCC 38327]|eukprot:KNE57070.1 hypothetical protein AMAG_02825 [Allomyces macrogynus ATCC 38327]